MSDFIAMDARANVLYTSFREQFSRAENVAVFKKIELNEKVESNIRNFVYPSYKKFDIKQFHRNVLEHGSVPLDVLERLVIKY